MTNNAYAVKLPIYCMMVFNHVLYGKVRNYNEMCVKFQNLCNYVPIKIFGFK